MTPLPPCRKGKGEKSISWIIDVADLGRGMEVDTEGGKLRLGERGKKKGK